jgi:hypothetical protein
LDDGRVQVARGQCILHRGAGEAYMPVFEALEGLCRGPNRDATMRCWHATRFVGGADALAPGTGGI